MFLHSDVIVCYSIASFRNKSRYMNPPFENGDIQLQEATESSFLSHGVVVSFDDLNFRLLKVIPTIFQTAECGLGH